MEINARCNAIFAPVHAFRGRYVFLRGSAGSGKSVDTAQQYILRLMAQPGRNLLCVRKCDATNRNSTFAELRRAIRTLGVQRFWTAQLAPLGLRCANGCEILFRGMLDDAQREKIKSISFENGKLTDIWLEEATELSRGDFNILDDRLRGELPPGLFYQIKATFNPVSDDHWIKHDFFDQPGPDILLHKSTYLDNRFLDDGFKKRMERRRTLDPEGYRVYGLGEWGCDGGLILTNWTVENFDCCADRFDFVVNAQDFGFHHADCIGEIGFRDGELFVLREIYEHEKDTGELIRLARERRFRADIPMFCDSAEPDRILMWRRAGFPRAIGVKKGAGSVRAQIDILRGMRIHIRPECVNVLREIRQWRWQRDPASGACTDVPVPVCDDAMAMLRYSVEPLRAPRVRAQAFRGGI